MSFNLQLAIDAAFKAADDEIAALKSQIVDLEHQGELLLAAVDKAEKREVELNEDIIALELDIALLKTRVAELEAGGGNNPAPQPEPEPEPEPETPPVTGLKWPKTADTGPRAGVKLAAYTGPMNITKAGTVISGKIISGTLQISADDVTIEDCRVKATSQYAIWQSDGFKKATVRYCEIDGTGSSRMVGIALQADALIEHNDIHGMVIGIQTWGNRPVIRKNYIHDLAELSTNPDHRHFDGIHNIGASEFLFENNAIIMPSSNGGTAAIFVSAQNAAIRGGKLVNNLCVGEAAWTVSVEKSKRGLSGVEITGNYVENGIYGAINNDTAGGATESGNVTWNDKQPSSVPEAVKAWRAAA